MDGWPADETAASAGRHRNASARVYELAGRNAVGAEHFAAGRFAEAVPAFGQALAGCRSELGAEHLDTLTVAGNLGVARVAAGHRREGIAQIRANLADRIRVLGDTDPRTLTAREPWPPRSD